MASSTLSLFAGETPIDTDSSLHNSTLKFADTHRVMLSFNIDLNRASNGKVLSSVRGGKNKIAAKIKGKSLANSHVHIGMPQWIYIPRAA